jgi:hypothetical protein
MMEFPLNSTAQQQKEIRRRSLPFTMIGDLLYRRGRDGILRRVVTRFEAKNILPQCHDGTCGGHFAENTTARKILTTGYY